MSQIIIIDSAEALAEQIAEVLSMNAPHIVATIASCLHPIEVPSDAEELVEKIREGATFGHDLSERYCKLLDDLRAAICRKEVVG